MKKLGGRNVVSCILNLDSRCRWVLASSQPTKVPSFQWFGGCMASRDRLFTLEER